MHTYNKIQYCIELKSINEIKLIQSKVEYRPIFWSESFPIKL